MTLPQTSAAHLLTIRDTLVENPCSRRSMDISITEEARKKMQQIMGYDHWLNLNVSFSSLFGVKVYSGWSLNFYRYFCLTTKPTTRKWGGGAPTVLKWTGSHLSCVAFQGSLLVPRILSEVSTEQKECCKEDNIKNMFTRKCPRKRHSCPSWFLSSIY